MEISDKRMNANYSLFEWKVGGEEGGTENGIYSV